MAIGPSERPARGVSLYYRCSGQEFLATSLNLPGTPVSQVLAPAQNLTNLIPEYFSVIHQQTVLDQYFAP